MSRASAWAVAIACIAGACVKKKLPPGEAAVLRAAASVEVPTIDRATHALPEAATIVVVSQKDVRIDGDPRPIATIPADAENGFASDDKFDGRRDSYVTPLAHALVAAHDAHKPHPDASAAPAMTMLEEKPAIARAWSNEPWERVVVVADRRTPFRVIAEIAYTAGYALGQVESHPSVHLVAQHGGAFFEVPLHPRWRSSILRRRPRPVELAMRVVFADDGIHIFAVGQHVAPGCNDVGEGATIPGAVANYDFAALGACLKKVKEASPDFADETEVTIAASARVDVQTIVRAVEACVRAPDGGELFTDVDVTP